MNMAQSLSDLWQKSHYLTSRFSRCLRNTVAKYIHANTNNLSCKIWLVKATVKLPLAPTFSMRSVQNILSPEVMWSVGLCCRNELPARWVCLLVSVRIKVQTCGTCNDLYDDDDERENCDDEMVIVMMEAAVIIIGLRMRIRRTTAGITLLIATVLRHIKTY